MAEMKLNVEQFNEAMKCKTPAELVEYIKSLGHDLTLEDAEKFLAQTADMELPVDSIEMVSGGQFCFGAVGIVCLGVGI